MSEDAPQVKEKPKESAPSKAAAVGGGIVAMGTNIEIYPGTRLSEYDVGPIKAYQALEKEGRGEKCFALVCEPHLVPRLRAAPVYASILNSTLLYLVKHDVVYWPPAKQQRCVFVYRDPGAKRMLAPGAKPALAWRQETVMTVLVPALIGALSDFRNKDFVHGSILPSNIFVRGVVGGNIEKVILGDCLTLPPSYTQTALYEPVERAMADPVSRGLGSPADDLYAFGVSLAVVLRSNDPCEGMSEEEIITKKVEIGSYSTLTGKDRFKGSVLELLRGLLHDDRDQRWTIDEVMSWMDGRRLSPKQFMPQKKAQRSFPFAGEKYTLMRLLAMDLARNTSEAVKVIESGELEQWVVRSIDDDESTLRMEEAMKIVWEGNKASGYEDRLLSSMSQALDPAAPVRFRGLSLLADGAGTALAEAFVLKKDIKIFADMFMQGLILNWVGNNARSNIDTGSLISRFDSCRNYLRQTRIGFGIERCLYVLCPEVHCLSEKLKDYFVRSSDDLIIAFEDMCRQGQAPASFIDRHVAAFLSVKDSKSIDSFLYDLDSPDQFKKILGNLRCMAAIQKRADIKALPALARTFRDMMAPVYLRYHDRDVRDKIRKSVDKYAEEGSLVKIAGILSNVDVIGKDRVAFKSAMAEYKNLTAEAERLEARLADKDIFGKSTGKDVAATISTVLSAIVIVFLAIAFLIQ